MGDKLDGQTLEAIGRWVDEARIPCDCSTWKFGGKRGDVILRGRNIDCYPHEGGFNVKPYGSKQWVYVRCDACGYDWALAKLIRRATLYKNHPEMYIE